MFKLLTKDVEFYWDDSCHIHFEILRDKLSITLVLRGANWPLPFKIFIDAFDTALA